MSSCSRFSTSGHEGMQACALSCVCKTTMLVIHVSYRMFRILALIATGSSKFFTSNNLGKSEVFEHTILQHFPSSGFTAQ
jgi:hypothetical protein